MDNELLVKSIKELCKKNNIAISQLESDLKFGAGLISRWNKNSPSLDKIVDIANYFHVSIDEVVGHNRNLDDEFITKLYNQTGSNEIVWDKVTNDMTSYPEIKLYNRLVDEYPPRYYDESYFGEIHYAMKYNNGYIIMYAFCKYDSILNPKELKLFIQPTLKSYLVEQKYYQNTLLSLWVKILNNLEDNAPDEVKAEDLKNSFVLNNSKLDSKSTIDKKTDLSNIQDIVNSPEIIKLMEIYNQPAFQEMREIFNNPEFQAAIQIANKLQNYFDK